MVVAFYRGLILLGVPVMTDTSLRNVGTIENLKQLAGKFTSDGVISWPWLPQWKSLHNYGIPVFLAIGDEDPIQNKEEQRQTEEYMKSLFGGHSKFVIHGPKLGHTTSSTQLDDVADFIRTRWSRSIRAGL